MTITETPEKKTQHTKLSFLVEKHRKCLTRCQEKKGTSLINYGEKQQHFWESRVFEYVGFLFALYQSLHPWNNRSQFN